MNTIIMMCLAFSVSCNFIPTEDGKLLIQRTRAKAHTNVRAATEMFLFDPKRKKLQRCGITTYRAKKTNQPIPQYLCGKKVYSTLGNVVRP